MDPMFPLNGGGKKKRVYLCLKEQIQALDLYRQHWKIVNGYGVADPGWNQDERVRDTVRKDAAVKSFRDIRWEAGFQTEKEARRKANGHGKAGNQASASARRIQAQIDELLEHNKDLQAEVDEIKARMGGFILREREKKSLYPT